MIEAIWPTLRLLCLALLLGRLVLSFLPPGEPGGHSVAKLPVTLAASLVLGLGLMLPLQLLSQEFWLVAVGLCAGGWLVRWATSPAGIVPRHELGRERGSWLSRLLFVGALLPASTYWTGGVGDAEDLGDFHLFALLNALALLVLVVCVEHGLATARRAPLGRSMLLLALGLYLYREQASPDSGSELFARVSAVCYGSGAAFALGWLRRADRRSGALALACFAAAGASASLDALVLSAAAMLALVLCTARPSRAWIAKASAIVLALPALCTLLDPRWSGPSESGAPYASLLRLTIVIATLASVAWIGRSIAARSRPEPAEWRDALARGDRFLILLLLLGIGICWVLPAAGGIVAGPASVFALAPVAFLLAGCVSIRPERAA